jgi:branched-chain amino acid transport system ATP-binding protein
MLKIENLNVYYGGVHALRGISLEVPEGQVVTLIGANGAGKSSTLRTICGLVKPQEGRVFFQGEDITGMKASERVKQGIAMVPEGRRIFTNLSVFDNLLMGAYTRDDTASIKEDLEKVYNLFPTLEKRRTQKALTLSGGEQQMLAVGRALMSGPKLLLMDEPSLGLAPILVSDLYKAVAQIHAEGLTVMLVEQNAHAALQVADYGYVLEIGRIVLEGTSAELADNEDVKKAYIGA